MMTPDLGGVFFAAKVNKWGLIWEQQQRLSQKSNPTFHHRLGAPTSEETPTQGDSLYHFLIRCHRLQVTKDATTPKDNTVL